MSSTPRRRSPGRTDLRLGLDLGGLRRSTRLLGCCLGSGLLAMLLSGCFSAPPQIISLDPNRGSTSVAANAPVQVIFDRPVDRATLTGHFSVRPAIPGCDLPAVFSARATAPCWIRWLTSAPGFELIHTGAVFGPATRYTFTLAGGFADPQGDRNGLDHHWDITTATAPAVASSTPPDRSAGVAIDTSLSVSFTAPMDAPSTTAAITIDPPVPGTTVVRNSTDHSRFVILPGGLLDPGISYTVTVAASARGEDGQFLAASRSVRFICGSRLGGAHAVVLAGMLGEGSTEVLLPGLPAGPVGEPIALPMLLRAPRCALVAGCGGLPLQAPLQTYAAATVTPDGSHLAVVVDDSRTTTSSMLVIDTATDTQLVAVPGGGTPSWSPDGTRLALSAPAGVEVYDIRARTLAVVAAGASVIAPPLWTANGTLVISTTGASGTAGAVELVDPVLGARYDLPGAPPPANAVAISPAGTHVAVATAGGSTVVVPTAGAAGGVQRVEGGLLVLGFAGESTLVAISGGGGGGGEQLVLLSVRSGDTTAVALTAGLPDLRTVRVAPGGRRLAWMGSDATGARQAYVADADGTGEVPMTRFLAGGLQAQAVAFSS